MLILFEKGLTVEGGSIVRKMILGGRVRGNVLIANDHLAHEPNMGHVFS